MTENEPSNARVMDVDGVRHRLHVLAHDMRSMLGPIIGYAELIASSDDIEQCRSHATRIMQASARLEGLADGLPERVLDGPVGTTDAG
ncbi:MAG: hypothetical protein OER95_17300 [Acidimicrobiia bacterium]|nr:hypothetical protein [Acidimicrobiia bacterium]